MDGDGVNGETSTVKIRVVSAGQVYDFGTRNLGTVNATCGGSACLDAGDLGLTADRRVTAGRCTVSGQVFLRDGVTPAAGAMVVAWDDVVPPELVTSLCFPSGQAPLCTFLGTAAADGSYSFTTASMGGLTLFANLTRPVEAGVTEYALAQRLLGDCPSPSAPVNLRLDEGFLVVQGQAGLAGDVISWTPATYPASFLWVMSGAGATKWMIQAAEGQPFPTPVTYGTLPSGAIQSLPASGAPAALASGDVITVLFAGTTADGSPLTGTATYTVP